MSGVARVRAGVIGYDRPIEDRQLVDRARRGDAEAFGHLVSGCSASAHRVATVVLGTSDGAADVVQDASIRAWRAVGTLDPGRGFRSWFLRAVANTARNDRRSRGRRAALAVRADRLPTAPPPEPEVAAVTAEERSTVVDALSRLPEADRLVVALRYFEDLSQAEMAEVLGCPSGTVKSRLSRAMARLRHELDHTAGNGEDADD